MAKKKLNMGKQLSSLKTLSITKRIDKSNP